jgi:hypothetical protein
LAELRQWSLVIPAERAGRGEDRVDETARTPELGSCDAEDDDAEDDDAEDDDAGGNDAGGDGAGHHEVRGAGSEAWEDGPAASSFVELMRAVARLTVEGLHRHASP